MCWIPNMYSIAKNCYNHRPGVHFTSVGKTGHSAGHICQVELVVYDLFSRGYSITLKIAHNSQSGGFVYRLGFTSGSYFFVIVNFNDYGALVPCEL